MYTAVIFDMDGVLIDSQPMHFEADLLALKEAGYADASLETVEKYAGTSSLDRWTRYKELFALANTVPELIATNVRHLHTLVQKNDLHPIEGIPELLQCLKEKNIKTAVASSSSYAFIDLILQKIGIASYFDAVVSGEDMKKGKPAPDIFLKAAAVLDTPPSACAVVEDSHNGVLAAKAAHMTCIAYVNPTSGHQDLQAADVIIESFRDAQSHFIKRV